MKVVCPHCSAAYNIDDRRIPATGLNVRCPKCRDTFPVRAPEGQPAAVPLPSPGRPAAAVPPAPGSIPLPAPGGGPGPAPRAASIPLPPPAAARSAPAIAPPPPPAVAPPPPSAAIPLPAPPEEDAFAEAAPEAPPETGAPAFEGAIQVEEPFAAAPLPVPTEPPAPEAPEPLPSFETEPFAAAPAEPPVPAATEEPLGFGEVDLSSTAPEARPAPDPFAAAVPPPPPAPPPASEELEMLFGEGSPKPGKPAAQAGAYRVRRRSGKIFGPFEEGQIVEMLGKGELMGNEDVSASGGDSWVPIGAVAAFGEALRKLAAEPTSAPAPAPAAGPKRVVPYGTRMAAARVTEGGGEPVRRWVKIAIPAVILVVLLLAGAGAGFTRYGFFFSKLLRRADAARVAALTGQARAAAVRDDYPAQRQALDVAAQAVAADPLSPEAAALHAMIVSALEQRHGVPPGAAEQAQRAANRLDKDERGEVTALAARLAVTLVSTPGTATAPLETALERAAQKVPPDAEIVALLARAALARGDAPRAAALFQRLEALEPAGPRGPHGLGRVAVLQRDAAAAKAAFERALGKFPEHLASRLELAALAEAAGDVTGAEAQLAPLLADAAAAKLAPAERGRALALRGSILSRRAAAGAEADKAFEAALAADPRLLDARMALAEHRLHHADAAGAVAALDPVAQAAAATPALAAVRIRALAAAGRALDASSLATAALQKAPGDPALLLAKAAALEASAKPDEAAQLYQDAAARDPSAFEPRLALGRINLARNDLAKAAIEIAAAVEKGPKEPAAQAMLGELAVAQGNLAGAEAAFRAALALDPEYSPAEIGLARLALARGDAKGARARLERALAVDPRSVEGHVVYGTLLWDAKEHAGAEKALQAAVDLAPQHAVALARLGAVKLERDDVDGAVQRLTAASNEDTRLVEARRWLGRALLRKGETPGAIAQLRKAIEIEPRNRENHLYLGAALERSGALPEAIEAYRAASALDPRYVDAWERIGALYFANGRFDDAVSAYERAVAVGPRIARLRIALGDCKARLGKHDEAVRIFREVLKSDPAAVHAIYRLARSLHESEGARVALPLYERAAREDTKNPMPHYYLGYLYKERNQRAKAVQEFRKYLQMRPDAEEKKDIESEIEDLGGGARTRE